MKKAVSFQKKININPFNGSLFDVDFASTLQYILSTRKLYYILFYLQKLGANTLECICIEYALLKSFMSYSSIRPSNLLT